MTLLERVHAKTSKPDTTRARSTHPQYSLPPAASAGNVAAGKEAAAGQAK